jgi:hypothetical protein
MWDPQHLNPIGLHGLLQDSFTLLIKVNRFCKILKIFNTAFLPFSFIMGTQKQVSGPLARPHEQNFEKCCLRVFRMEE